MREQYLLSACYNIASISDIVLRSLVIVIYHNKFIFFHRRSGKKPIELQKKEALTDYEVSVINSCLNQRQIFFQGS